MMSKGFTVFAAASRYLSASHNCHHGQQLEHHGVVMGGSYDHSFVPMECGADTAPCELSEGIQGFYVCRQSGTNSGDRSSTCIAPEKGLEGDMCGCCGDILCAASQPKN